MSIRLGLLALLRDGPKHGYLLKSEFEAATGGIWPLNVGQVYTTVDRLVRDGSVEVDVRGEQKLYAITAAGREELAAWWKAEPVDGPPPRDELVVKVLLAVASTPADAMAVITAQRTALTEVLQSRRRQARGADRSLAARLAADAVALRIEGDLRWLDLCEARLGERRRVEARARKTNKEVHR